jgi:hypothetical protein
MATMMKYIRLIFTLKLFSIVTALLLLQAIMFAPTAYAQTPPVAGQAKTGFDIVGESITGASEVLPDTGKTASKLELVSSDAKLVEVFKWAQRQAMAFAFDVGDPVGPWYEAVEPGREGFCMRDTAHQAMGAHALGLAKHNLNMLRRFAENISNSRDWCSLWEINRYNQPAPVDYKNDAEFWFNLPANFDVLDCCFRMYVWTGDQTYIKDPVFLNYYDRTVNDYVERWGLGLDDIMKRPRLLNVRGVVDPKKKFQISRGIPGYNEGDYTYVLGFDVLATQYAAYVAYANIQEVRGNVEQAQKFQKKAADLKEFLYKTWWNEKDQSFYERLNKDYKLEGGSGRRRARGLEWGTVRFDNPDADNARLLDISRSRLEYPEVSYSKVGDIVNGTMGINLEFSSPLLASVKGYWVETSVKTLSGLGTKIAWAEIRNLPIRSNEVTVRHEGSRKSIFTNQRGPALIWLPTFAGEHVTLLVNGRPMKAQIEKGNPDRITSSVRVTVGGGGTVRVEIPE